MEFAPSTTNHTTPPNPKTNMDITELLAKQDGGDFLRAIAAAVLQLLMKADVEGLEKTIESAPFTHGQIPHSPG